MHRPVPSSAARVAAIALGVSITGCAPYLISYEHVCVDESPTLRIIKVSAQSNASDGSPLLAAKVGLPVEARLEGNGYEITIHTPVNSQSVAFLNAHSSSGSPLVLVGPNLRRLQQNYQYSFLVRETKGSPISFSVFDSQGKLLGTELITYRIQSRGFTYGIEAI